MQIRFYYLDFLLPLFRGGEQCPVELRRRDKISGIRATQRGCKIMASGIFMTAPENVGYMQQTVRGPDLF